MAHTDSKREANRLAHSLHSQLSTLLRAERKAVEECNWKEATRLTKDIERVTKELSAALRQ